MAKADFSTSHILVQEREGEYQIGVTLVNSGGLSAERVSVFVLYPNALTYHGGTQQKGTITTHGSALGQFVEWRLEDVGSEESSTLNLSFTPTDDADQLSETSFSVSIVSPVSIPLIRKVVIGAETETFSRDPDRFQRFLNAFYIRYVSFKRWLVQRFFDRD